MEEKLRALLSKIETSDLTDGEKDKMLEILIDELQTLVQPVLLKYIDPAKLEAAANDANSVTVERYIFVMKDALANPQAFQELEQAMGELLVEYEDVMKKGGLIV